MVILGAPYPLPRVRGSHITALALVNEQFDGTTIIEAGRRRLDT